MHSSLPRWSVVVIFFTLLLFQNCSSNDGINSGFSTENALDTYQISNQNTGLVSSAGGDVSAGGVSQSQQQFPNQQQPGSGQTSQNSNSLFEADCPVASGAFAVYDWPRFSSSTAVHIASIPAQSGVSLKFTVDLVAYPLGFRMSDVGIGAKNYSISTCPGIMDHPAFGQNGSTSVNGDAYIDNCNTLPFIRYPGYDNQNLLQSQSTCWLQPGKIYYLNIWNVRTDGSSEIQLQNGKMLR